MTTLSLEIDSVEPDTLRCRALNDVSLPCHLDMTVHGSGLHNKLPILCQDDKDKIRELCQQGVHMHYLCLAYCRSAKDIETARQFLEQCAP
jgi:pyruvate kinase